jgi:hypothetical protein
MTEADIDEILSRVDRLDDGRWLALASRFLDGTPVGPFRYYGRRKDDPNDRIDHEHRRELRGLNLFAAWINHFDTKQHNSLDMYVTEGERGFVRHYLIDFASTLGSGAAAEGPSPRYGYEYGFDPKAMLRRTFTLGFVEDRWRRRTRDHGFTEVGYFDTAWFEPDKFRPLQPNNAFARMTDRDAYWAAKIIAAFRDDHIRAIVAAGGYQQPGATDYVAGVLATNRDAIARFYFDRVAPLDFFTVRADDVRYRDLGHEYGLYSGQARRYRHRWAVVDAERKPGPSGWSVWVVSGTTAARIGDEGSAAALASSPEGDHPFLALEVQIDRGGGWSRPVTAYIARGSRRVAAVDR